MLKPNVMETCNVSNKDAYNIFELFKLQAFVPQEATNDLFITTSAC